MALVFNGNKANYLQKSITFTASKGTVCGRFRLTSDPNTYQVIFQMNATDNAQMGLYTSVDGTTLSSYLGASDSTVTGSSLSLNTWYHIAVTWNGTSLITYLDGVANITHTNTGSTWNEIRLGFDLAGWDDSFTGNIADVLAWDDTFTVAQIQQQMYRKVPVTPVNLKLWMPTFDGTGERNADYSGAGNALTVNGTITDVANPPVSWGAPVWVVPFVTSAGAQTITPDAIASAATVYAPTLAAGAVTIAPAAIASTATVYAPTLSGAAAGIQPDAIASTAQVYAPTLAAGAVTITPAAISSGAAVYAPTLTPAVATITPAFIASTSTVYAPTLTPGARTVTPAAIASTSTVYAPELLARATIGGVLEADTTNPRYFRNASGIVVLAGFDTWYTLWDGDTSEPVDAFDYGAWLDYVDARGCNWHKLWAMESARDWDDVTAYFSDHYYQRTGPGNAADGKLKFDVTKLNDAYFARLRERVILAGNRGHYVTVQLFQGWQIDQHGINGGAAWTYHPFKSGNNINGISGDANSDGDGREVHSSSAAAGIITAQRLYVARVLDTLNDLDNVIYEICNEDNSVATSWQWQKDLVTYCHSYEAGLPKQHPIGATHIWSDSDSDLIGTGADWISSGNGESMTDMDEATGDIVRCLDTDHIVGLWYDHVYVWQAFTRGNNPWYMDEYDGAGALYGTDRRSQTSVEKIRYNLGRVLTYAAQLDLANTTPHNSLASTGYCLAKTTGAVKILAYQDGSGSFTVNLTSISGTFSVEWLRTNSVSLVTSAGSNISGGAVRTLTPPWAGEDALVFIEKLADEITPGFINSAATVYAPTLTPGAVTITPNAISSAAVVHAPTLTAGAVAIAPDAIASGAAVYAPALAAGAVTVTPAAIGSTAAVYAPTLTLVIFPAAIASGATVYAPTLVPGAVTIAPDTIASAAAVYAPTLTPAAPSIHPDAIASAAQVFAPTLAAGAVTIAPDAIASGAQVFAPTLTSGAIIYPDAIASVAVVYAPTLTPGSVTLAPDAIASSAAVYAPTVQAGAVTIAPDAIASVAVVYAPTLTGAAPTIYPDAIGSTAQVFAPALTPGAATIAPDAIASTAQVFQPFLGNGTTQTIAPDAIASTAQVFAATLAGIVASRIYRVMAEDRTYVVSFEDRTWTVQGE